MALETLGAFALVIRGPDRLLGQLTVPRYFFPGQRLFFLGTSFQVLRVLVPCSILANMLLPVRHLFLQSTGVEAACAVSAGGGLAGTTPVGSRGAEPVSTGTFELGVGFGCGVASGRGLGALGLAVLALLLGRSGRA